MSIFDTTAPTDLNSFSNPMNSMNMNSGGWGMNPSYLTPSYTASYRPGYGGGNGAGNGSRQPGLLNSASFFVNPFDSRTSGPNAPNSYQPYLESIHGRPMDAVMWANQRVIVPTLATAIAFSHLGTTAGAAAGEYLGSKFARGIVSGANAFIPEGFKITPMLSETLRTGASKLGRFGGGLFLPGLAAWAGTEAFNAGVVDPYIAFRKTGQSLRDNFANTMIAPHGGGNALTGMGLSFGTSNRIAGNITRQGIQDNVFSTREYGQVADYASRAGLLDDASIGQISGRVKQIANQVKMIMRVSNDPDVKNAIESLAKLKLGGATGASASSAFQNIGISSAIAGISTQRMMSTVGAQGGYLFGANGMVPYVGQMTAASNLAHFQTANRMGLISNSMMASMGGIEGATQAMTTAMVNGAQTPYNMMSNYNKYLGSGSRGGIMNNLAAFGASMAGNPIGVWGDMMLNKGMMSSAQLKERGPLALQDQIMDIARNMGLARNGRVSAGTAFAIANSMGIGEDNARAYVNMMGAAQLPGFKASQMAAVNASERTQSMRLLDQENIYGPMTPKIQALKKAGRGIMEGALYVSMAPVNLLGDVVDNFSKGFAEYRFGSLDRNINIENLDKERVSTRGHFKTTFFGDHTLKTINKLMDSDHPDAIILADKNASYEKKQQALNRLALEGHIPADAVFSSDVKSALDMGPTEGLSKSVTTDRGVIEKRLGTVANSAGGTFEKLEKIQARGKLLRNYTEQGLGAFEDEKLVEAAGYDRFDLAQKKAHLELYGKRRGELGTGQYEDPEIEAMAKKLLSSGKAKDETSAMLMALKATGRGTADNVSPYAKDLGSDAYSRLLDIGKAHAARRKQISEMVDEGKIDANTGGMLISTDSFGESVQKFGDWVSQLSGKTTPTGGYPNNEKNK